MPYNTREDLPEQVQDTLPKRAQDIYRKAYNSAWDRYSDPKKRRGKTSREEVAHKVAWNAVKQRYRKEKGKWVKKKE